MQEKGSDTNESQRRKTRKCTAGETEVFSGGSFCGGTAYQCAFYNIVDRIYIGHIPGYGDVH